MTFCNPFANFNNFIGGINTCFTPMFSSWSMPFCGGFPSFDLSWNMPSLFSYVSPPMNNFVPLMDFNIQFPPLPNVSNNNMYGANFNFTFPPLNTSSFSFNGIGDTFSFSGNKSCNLNGYNASAGRKLASVALNSAPGTTRYCAKYVKKAIEKSGFGAYKSGHAYQMTGILRQNSHFKEISPSSVNVKDLPAGCILVYNRGVGGYSKDYGHTEITTGDGRAVSDHVTQNLHKTPSAIFIPV